MNAPLPLSAVPPTWTTGTTEVFKTGTWRAALPRHIQAPSPCHQACPVGGEIAEWIGHARAGDWRRAFEALVRHNPFPAVAGRICHHPCESACNRSAHDEAVSICRLERFAGDRALAEDWALPAAAPMAAQPGRLEHVAVVGAGPAGLSAAYQMRRRGWRVTVYEAAGEPGGLLRHGIPPYRLPRDVLDAEIARIVALGVELRCGEALASESQWATLRARHDAVFVATGAAHARRLPGLDYDGTRVLDGAAWLRAANAGVPPRLGERVMVIGGGSAAWDTARSARRLGHEVTVLALEARRQLPAQREEVDEALEEGIRLVDGALLVHAVAGGAGLRLQCRRVRFVPGAARGAFTLEALPDSDFELDADALLASIGADPDLAAFGDTLARAGPLIAIDANGAAGMPGIPGTSGMSATNGTPGVWAGGDVASLARYFTEAVGMGQRAALAMHAVLVGRLPDAPTTSAAAAPASEPAVGAGAIATWYHAATPRAAAPRLAPAQRLGFDEVQLGLDAAAARAEAARCFSCGTCIACDNCITVCPDLAVRHAAAGGYEVLGDYCKGCGLCVRECPTGSMTMREECR
ncbi:MAG: FAD-dependent oxidoreductase [Burkholderiales bacterium]|nr:FAD-dependent oxidoreductase [Burkholderiales bacterium]